MLKQLRIWLWKRRARKHYLAYKAELAAVPYGAGLARHLNVNVMRHSFVFNLCMDELAKLDPKTPKTRL